MSKENYKEKDISYFINPRKDIISLLPKKPDQKVLEIGMGGGDTLVYLKENKLAGEVNGIDIIDLPNTNQQNPLIDKTFFLDLEKVELPFEDNYFDVIIAGDVLEHLIDPWGTLKKLTHKLKQKGSFIISLPNIRDIKALYSILVKGKFTYTTQGIFDKTHFRFFCKKDMKNLIKSVDVLEIENIVAIQELSNNSPRRRFLNKITFKIFEEFLSTQYIIHAIKIK